jgi:hypothetical protein
VLSCCEEVLLALGRARGELAKLVLSLLVSLLLAGYMQGVHAVLEKWADKGTDLSLIRFYIMKVGACSDKVDQDQSAGWA